MSRRSNLVYPFASKAALSFNLHETTGFTEHCLRCAVVIDKWSILILWSHPWIHLAFTLETPCPRSSLACRNYIRLFALACIVGWCGELTTATLELLFYVYVLLNASKADSQHAASENAGGRLAGLPDSASTACLYTQLIMPAASYDINDILWIAGLTIILSFPHFVHAQGDISGTGSFGTSTIAVLYGLGLAAVSIRRFPVMNLTWTNELWARWVGITDPTQDTMQVRWYIPGSRSWDPRDQLWDMPCDRFNGLGGGRIIALGLDRPYGVSIGAWVCVDEKGASMISALRSLPRLGSCGGYHYWASTSKWWSALRLKSFVADVSGSTLGRRGCSSWHSVPKETIQEFSPADTSELRVNPQSAHYRHLDEENRVDVKDMLLVRDLAYMDTEYAALVTLGPSAAAGAFSRCIVAGESGGGAEKELTQWATSDDTWRDQDWSTFDVHGLRTHLASAVVPHVVESVVVLILPWFGITPFFVIEQVARKAIWSSLSTGTGRHVHAAAYSGYITCKLTPTGSIARLYDAPNQDRLRLLWIGRLVLMVGNYAVALWIQSGGGIILPTHDSILNPNAARAVSLTAAFTYIGTTGLAAVYTRAAASTWMMLSACAVVTAVTVSLWVGVIAPSVVGPAVLASEFVACMVQTAVVACIDDTRDLHDGWRRTSGALVGELRVAVIIALPRLAAWMAVGDGS